MKNACHSHCCQMCWFHFEPYNPWKLNCFLRNSSGSHQKTYSFTMPSWIIIKLIDLVHTLDQTVYCWQISKVPSRVIFNMNIEKYISQSLHVDLCILTSPIIVGSCAIYLETQHMSMYLSNWTNIWFTPWKFHIAPERLSSKKET